MERYTHAIMCIKCAVCTSIAMTSAELMDTPVVKYSRLVVDKEQPHDNRLGPGCVMKVLVSSSGVCGS